MTESEILELAMQCDFDTRDGFDGPLITFANAIAQRQREIDAGICEQAFWSEDVSVFREMTKHEVATKSMLVCAAAIRSMTK